MKILIITLIFVGLDCIHLEKLYAQGNCGFDYLHQNLLLKDPIYRQSVLNLNQQIYQRSQLALQESKAFSAMYVLPVVIHIVSPPGTLIGSGNNITDQQVEIGLEFLNQAFSNSGPFISAKGVDAGIQFCLAKRDPQGRPTNGITRHESALTNDPMCQPGTNSNSDGQIKQIVSWDCKKYINIWLVTDLFNGTFGCGLAGYAYFPGAPCSVDGIVQEARYWNTIGGTVVTAHELGHYLGLHHTFNGGCQNNDCMLDGDLVCDTPPDNSASFSACNTNSCATDLPDLVDDNDNFMDYSNCRPAHFTNGQKNRMIAALEISRSGLISSDGCLIVGEFDAAIQNLEIEGDFCKDTLCPKIVFKNLGIRSINQLNFFYSVNGQPEQNISWTGLLLAGQSDTIFLSCLYLPFGIHQIKVRVALPNPTDDLYLQNNEMILNFSNFPKPDVQVLNITATNCRSDGTITLRSEFGTEPYIYNISNRSFAQNDPYFQLLTAGKYTVTVTDQNGCSDTISVFVPDSCKSTTNKNFILNNDAINTGGDCYRLTQALNNQAGSMWYEDKVDFNNSFDVFFDFNLGCIDRNGADGLAFVLQPISTSIGVFGGGIGYQGIQPSLAIEFDTWDNNENNDPFYDHLAIMRNGTVGHNTADNLAGPVGIFPTLANAEDCMFHKGLIRWDATNKIVEVFVDCNRRLSLRVDLVKDIFLNDPNVFFGFTSATGGAVNVHQVCLNYITGINNIPDQIICQGESIQLSAPSVFSKYDWTPVTGISNPTIRNPIFTPDQTTTYILKMNDQCGLVYQDTVTIEVKQADLKVKASLLDSCAALDVILLEVLNPQDFPGAEYSLDGIQFSYQSKFEIGARQSVTIYAKLGNCITPRIIDLRDVRIPLKDSLIFTQSVTCKDLGIIVMSGIGGKPNYQYSLDQLNWNVDGIFNNLQAGIYRIYTKDELGCEVFRDVEISEFKRKLGLNIDSSKLTMNCCDPSNYIHITASGTFPFYYYSLDGQRWVSESGFYNLSPGLHQLIARDEFGCASDTLSFNILDQRFQDTVTQQISICARDSFYFNGNVYFNSGTYFDFFKNINCCDSLVVSILDVQAEINSQQNIVLCSGQSFTFNGNIYNLEGTYLDTLNGFQGCDSIVSTSLKFNPPAAMHQNVELCNGQYLEVGAKRYLVSGNYLDTLTTALGCDSVITTNLQIFPTSIENQNYLICEEQSITVGTNTYDLPGSYVDTVVNQFGCDSIILSFLRKDTVDAASIIVPSLCYGIHDGMILLNPLSGVPPFEYSLHDQNNWIQINKFENLAPGRYLVFVRDSLDCIKSFTLDLPNPFIPLTSLNPEIIISLGEKITLKPDINFTPSLIEWSPAEGLSCTNCLNPEANPIQDTNYKLRLLDENGCEIILEVKFKVNLVGDIFVPNVFSPNGDQINDRITVWGSQAFTTIDIFRIYSRWGELVFENSNFPVNDDQSGWDGRFNSTLLSPGVFVFYLKAKRLDGVSVELQGDISLIR
ncbi:MAG: gliding motility-associated C-terminal domain-containing protein [Saprospiraceae bacterium]|nr:gliding motility-associated C-terminal domain-containing protein [Saprospiraceae bacterium]